SPPGHIGVVWRDPEAPSWGPVVAGTPWRRQPMTIMTQEAPTQHRPGLVSVDGRTYPLETAKLTARAEGGLAFSRLSQFFANPHERALGVASTMPLPADGAVLGYTVRIGERVIRGVVEPREKAETAFQKALAEGRSAGLLEQNRDDTFQQW